MGWKKLILGEKMPDKNDPKYRERYEKEVEAGRKTARFLRLDKAAAAMQRFANNHRCTVIAIVFSIVLFVFTFNIWRIATVCGATDKRQTATEIQERKLNERKIREPHEVRPRELKIPNIPKIENNTDESESEEHQL